MLDMGYWICIRIVDIRFLSTAAFPRFGLLFLSYPSFSNFAGLSVLGEPPLSKDAYRAFERFSFVGQRLVLTHESPVKSRRFLSPLF